MEIESDVENGPPFKVFVGNIADDVEVDLIKEEFGHFGEIVDISFDIASAFISYGNKNEASAAIETMDGKEFMGEKIRVEFYIKPPKSPEVRFSGNFDNYHEEHRGYNRRQHSPDRQAFHQNDAFRDYSPPRK